MSIEEIKAGWKLKDQDKGAAVKWWDEIAPDFEANIIPSFQNNDFLNLAQREKMFDDKSEVLDIGCGTGEYAIAFASRVKSVTGIDFSPKMIEAANRRADILRVENVNFEIIDWHEIDVKKAGLEKNFDFVFAHMTPAVQSFETFEKISQCSKNWCALVKPVKSIDPIYKKILSLIDIEEKIKNNESEVLRAFSLLFLQEYYPMIQYHHNNLEMAWPFDRVSQMYINHTKTQFGISPKQENQIIDYLNSIARDGIIKETIETIIATVYWQVK